MHDARRFTSSWSLSLSALSHNCPATVDFGFVSFCGEMLCHQLNACVICLLIRLNAKVSADESRWKFLLQLAIDWSFSFSSFFPFLCVVLDGAKSLFPIKTHKHTHTYVVRVYDESFVSNVTREKNKNKKRWEERQQKNCVSSSWFPFFGSLHCSRLLLHHYDVQLYYMRDFA